MRLPPAVSAELAEAADQQPRRGFGAVAVTVRVGATSWRTSAFPGGQVSPGLPSYVVPVKKAVRERYGLDVGDEVTIDVELR